MYRTLRCDKYRIALLEKILRTYITTKKVSKQNLSITLFDRSIESLNNHANKIRDSIGNKLPSHYDVQINKTSVEAGSGSIPTEKLPSVAISFSSNKISSNKISSKLRSSSLPILSYIKDDRVFIDLKAIPDDQISELIDMIKKCL